MVCYLVTSSIAAVHALPMDAYGVDSRVTSNSVGTAPPNLASNAPDQHNAVLMAGSMPCHQDSATSVDGVNAANLCKIFCSAIAHAMVVVASDDSIVLLNHSAPRAKPNRFTTHLGRVDHQPPK
jgi:hypothetical protein